MVRDIRAELEDTRNTRTPSGAHCNPLFRGGRAITGLNAAFAHFTVDADK
jgi:hypothetical protein